MKIRVFSLCWGDAWERYGEVFAKSFHRFWPEEVELVMVADRQLPLPRGRVTDLTAIPGLKEFRGRWKGVKAASGIGIAGVKLDERGYSWRHDAMKWMPQAMAPLAVLDDMYDGDILAWFDADVETISKVPLGWLGELIGDSDIACLQRQNYHSEIGFYGVRVNARSRAALRHFAELFSTDAIFKQRQQHSAFAFDLALQSVDGLKIKNVNEGGAKGHAWPSIPLLAEYTVHKKGKRKDRRVAVV